MLKSKNLAYLISICVMFYACVEPYDLNVQQERKILTIDATITDLAEEQSVKIIESYSAANTVYAIPVAGAKVEIIVDNTERIPLTERSGGVYVLPLSFHTQVGRSYKLAFQRADGTRYESEVEKLGGIPAITNVYDEFKVDGIEASLGTEPAHYIYLDTEDPANEKNSYMWTWKLWEKQSICATCYGGRFFLNPSPGECKIEANYANATYDYNCNGDCWQIFYNKDLNVFSDVYSNGKPILGRLIAKIPYYAARGALIEIKQQSVSPNAFQYMKLLVNQVQNNGSLVDTPPAAIIGNVKNITNPDEAVAGFFMVTSVRAWRYWIGRENASGLARPIGLLGHTFIPEPSGPDLTRPPLAPCLEGKYRTPSKPDGWID
ncbi:DUF4249 domain-containing protein [Emticicia sp. 21SJ11W-3]|uniref:DUF4249 domain-containing protein n=1 Tax=Emticicia sp. 21SJ11W-3 TaxID=2916755 RepID=UPI00209F2389|nr:DUF4249 domain-containing protein [Emticicia sp. 21SJ11W-3]UTA69635.1 DUF4249 domain-containing protein [Emticicia sp. 21SJ11W-3]